MIITYALNNHRFMLDQSIIKSPTVNMLLQVLPGLTLKKYMIYPWNALIYFFALFPIQC